MRFLIAILLIHGSCYFACSATPLNTQNTIKVVTEILPPYQIETANKKVGGYATQVVKALFEVTGDRPDISAMPWPRAYGLAQKAQNVMIYSLSFSESRDQIFHWVGTLQKEQGFIWGLKKDFSKPFSHIDEARDYWLTTTQNSNPHMFLKRLNFKKLNLVSNPEQNVAMLFRNRTQLVIGAEVPFRYIATINGYDFSQVVKLYKVDELSTDLKLAFGPKTDEAIVKQYQQAFEQLKLSGKLDKIRHSWGM